MRAVCVCVSALLNPFSYYYNNDDYNNDNDDDNNNNNNNNNNINSYIVE